MDEHGVITIRTAATNRDVEVALSDTGCGIPPEVIDRTFDPFFTTRDGGGGTGLGLAIADGIVTRHRGPIHAESTVGRGTTFVIRAPAAGPGLAAAMAAAGAAAI